MQPFTFNLKYTLWSPCIKKLCLLCMKIVKLPNRRVQAACGLNAKNNNELSAKHTMNFTSWHIFQQHQAYASNWNVRSTCLFYYVGLESPRHCFTSERVGLHWAKPGISKLRPPAGQIRPAKLFHPTSETILSAGKEALSIIKNWCFYETFAALVKCNIPRNNHIIYLRCPAIKLLCNSACGPLIKQFGDPW